jgi:hypothetical protein
MYPWQYLQPPHLSIPDVDVDAFCGEFFSGECTRREREDAAKSTAAPSAASLLLPSRGSMVVRRCLVNWTRLDLDYLGQQKVMMSDAKPTV